MKKPKYRLQTVLDMREKAKKDAAQLVALRRQQLAEAERELEKCRKAVQDNLNLQAKQRSAMHDEMIDGAAARRILSHRTYLADLREQELELRANVVKQEKVVEKAESEVEKALELLTEATKEVKVIEKHKETWRVNLKKETERKEQKLNDEIGAILFQNHPARNKK
jgi:flagellar export protein FliJ